MVRKVIDNLGMVGLVLAAFGLVYYSINKMWDLQAQIAVYAGLGFILIYLLANLKSLKERAGGRRFRMGGTALASAVLVLGILALVNFLNTRHHKRIDLSEGGMHGLSEQTRKVLENLEQDIQLLGFFSQEPEAARFQTTAQEFKYLTPRVSYEVIDPQENPGRVNQYEITRDGQVVVSGDLKREILDDASEEKLTNAIIKVTRDIQKKVYFLTGHGERSLDGSESGDYSTAKAEIEKQNYLVDSINLAQTNQIPEDASLIVSAGPKVNFFPNEISLLENYLSVGGKFFLLLDPESEFEMNEFLAQYGLEVSNKFVVDASGLGQLFGFGAGAPLAADYADHPITEDLSQTMTIFPTARSLSTAESTLEYTSSALVSTSPQSWAETDINSEEVSFDEGVDDPGPIAIAVVSSKSVPSRKDSGDDEAESETDVESENPQESPLDFTSPGPDQNSRDSRIVVIGDSDFASNGYIGTSVNGDLFLNVISWMAEDADLLSIRPKDPENRTVTLTSAESRLVFWATVIFFPLAAVVFGVAVWYRRR
jgi:ABC-type uncharacterized transport system involved in gliding motility auxiliary subunit